MKNATAHEPEELPPFTAARKAALKELTTLRDEQIGTSDIPHLSDAFWRSAVRNPF